jgi:hypothetical protein
MVLWHDPGFADGPVPVQLHVHGPGAPATMAPDVVAVCGCGR